MDNIVLYTTHCPMCEIIEQKFAENHIQYLEVDDLASIEKLNVISVPIAVINGQYYDFPQIIEWLKRGTKNEN